MEITNKTYSEVYAILNLLSFDQFLKIPNNIWKSIEEKRDREVEIEIDNINDYVPSNEANYLLASIYKKYFATPEEKDVIKAKEKTLYEKRQKELYEKYNPDNLFKNRVSKVETVENTVSMVEYKESIFTKIKNWFKRTFQQQIEIMCKAGMELSCLLSFQIPFFFHFLVFYLFFWINESISFSLKISN